MSISTLIDSTLSDTLPDVLSDLTELALNDLLKCLDDPKYIINMQEWYSPIKTYFNAQRNKCEICFAGAVIAQEGLTTNRVEDVQSTFSAPIACKLYALNHIRNGFISLALAELIKSKADPLLLTKEQKKITEHYLDTMAVEFNELDPQPFIDYIRQMIIDLRSVDL